MYEILSLITAITNMGMVTKFEWEALIDFHSALYRKLNHAAITNKRKEFCADLRLIIVDLNAVYNGTVVRRNFEAWEVLKVELFWEWLAHNDDVFEYSHNQYNREALDYLTKESAEFLRLFNFNSKTPCDGWNEPATKAK